MKHSYNTNFDNVDASVDGIVCIQQNTITKFRPIITVNSSHNNDKHKPWLTNEIKSLIKKIKSHNKFLKKPLFYGKQYRTIRNRLINIKKCAKKYFCLSEHL